VRIDEWRERRVNTLRGFARVVLPSGMVLEEVAVHQGPDHCWCGMPAKPMIDSTSGVAMRDLRTGKVRYQQLVSFTSRDVRDRLTQQILHALDDQYPDALDSADAVEAEVAEPPLDDDPSLTGGPRW
jgi:DNA-binding cell septation regulator SpoVG